MSYDPDDYASRLDELLDCYDGDCDVRGARAELAALRQRCEDAETLLRLAINSGIHDRGDGTFFCWSHRLGDPLDILPKGMDGLPALTDEARKALRGGS